MLLIVLNQLKRLGKILYVYRDMGSVIDTMICLYMFYFRFYEAP